MKTTAVAMVMFLLLMVVPAQAADKTQIAMIAFDTPFLAACRGLRDGLAQLDLVEGRDVVLTEYNLENDQSRLSPLICELAAKKVDLVFAVTTPVALQVRDEAEKYNIPVIFTVVADPVGSGIVTSLRQPGTMSGISHIAFELVPKRLLLFKDAFPGLRKVAVFYDPGQKGLSRNRDNHELMAAAREAGVELVEFHVRDKDQMIRACAAITGKIVDGIFMVPDTIATAFFDQMLELSRREKLPLMVIDNLLLAKGGVMGYSPDFYDVGFQAANMIRCVMSGIEPGKLPVQNPDQIKLVVSLKEINRLGLTISQEFLTGADEILR